MLARALTRRSAPTSVVAISLPCLVSRSVREYPMHHTPTMMEQDHPDSAGARLASDAHHISEREVKDGDDGRIPPPSPREFMERVLPRPDTRQLLERLAER